MSTFSRADACDKCGTHPLWFCKTWAALKVPYEANMPLQSAIRSSAYYYEPYSACWGCIKISRRRVKILHSLLFKLNIYKVKK